MKQHLQHSQDTLVKLTVSLFRSKRHQDHFSATKDADMQECIWSASFILQDKNFDIDISKNR